MLERLPTVPGAYILWMELTDRCKLEIARLGNPRLPAGYYAYCGSARGPGGMRARVARHLRATKSLHWHIDHLTVTASVSAVSVAPDGLECAMVDWLLSEPDVSIPVPAFGSSDCRRCPAHLLELPNHRMVRQFNTIDFRGPANGGEHHVQDPLHA